ncbi:MAG: hypothetical protein U0R49_02110 [Fimbriimonadales bacterium]
MSFLSKVLLICVFAVAVLFSLGEVLVYEYDLSRTGSAPKMEDVVGGWVHLPPGWSLGIVALICVGLTVFSILWLLQRSSTRSKVLVMFAATALAVGYLTFVPSEVASLGMVTRLAAAVLSVGNAILGSRGRNET